MNELVRLAKEAVEKYIKENKKISPPSFLSNKFLNEKAGIFVTIKKDGSLRGCMGTWTPQKENIAKEIIENAIAAATKDRRFSLIKENELSQLSYEIYVLDEPELIENLKNLDPKKYGIMVRTSSSENNKHLKTGLLLPNLKGIKTKEKQIAVACQKAGINPKEEKIVIYRFTAQKYE